MNTEMNTEKWFDNVSALGAGSFLVTKLFEGNSNSNCSATENEDVATIVFTCRYRITN